MYKSILIKLSGESLMGDVSVVDKDKILNIKKRELEDVIIVNMTAIQVLHFSIMI